MLIVIKLFAEDQSEFDSPELDSPMPSSSELQSCRAIMAAHLINSDRLALGVFRKSVEHAFCATLYASCLFFPVHLSWKRKYRVVFITSSRFARGYDCTGVLKNVFIGHWDMVSAAGGRSDTSGVTKEPYHRCAEGAGGKNWPK